MTRLFMVAVLAVLLPSSASATRYAWCFAAVDHTHYVSGIVEIEEHPDAWGLFVRGGFPKEFAAWVTATKGVKLYEDPYCQVRDTLRDGQSTSARIWTNGLTNRPHTNIPTDWIGDRPAAVERAERRGLRPGVTTLTIPDTVSTVTPDSASANAQRARDEADRASALREYDALRLRDAQRASALAAENARNRALYEAEVAENARLRAADMAEWRARVARCQAGEATACAPRGTPR